MIDLKQFVELNFKEKLGTKFSDYVNDCGVLSNYLNQSIVLTKEDLTCNYHKFSINCKDNTYVVTSPFIYTGRKCGVNISLNTSDYKIAVQRLDNLLQAKSFAIKGDPNTSCNIDDYRFLTSDVVAIEYNDEKIQCNSSFVQELENYKLDHNWNDIQIINDVFSSIKPTGILLNVKNILQEKKKEPEFLISMAKGASITFIVITILWSWVFGFKNSIKIASAWTCLTCSAGIVKGARDRDNKIKSFQK